MSLDPNRPNVITVTTPLGATVHDTNTFHLHTSVPPTGGTPSLTNSGNLQWSSHASTDLENGQESSNGAIATAQQARLLSNLDHTSGMPVVEGQQYHPDPPPDINHALEYLHKVHQRYPDDPEKYNGLLRILAAHHQAKRPLFDVSIHIMYIYGD